MAGESGSHRVHVGLDFATGAGGGHVTPSLVAGF
jgi:hypothetical protein